MQILHKAALVTFALLAIVIVLLMARDARRTTECPRLLALTMTEREVLLMTLARPDCASTVTDSLLAPRIPAEDSVP